MKPSFTGACWALGLIALVGRAVALVASRATNVTAASRAAVPASAFFVIVRPFVRHTELTPPTHVVRPGRRLRCPAGSGGSSPGRDGHPAGRALASAHSTPPTIRETISL